jgi:chaperonin GroEL
VIKVGGASEVEVKNARTASTMRCTQQLSKKTLSPAKRCRVLYAPEYEGLKGENDDQTRGIDVVRKDPVANPPDRRKRRP